MANSSKGKKKSSAGKRKAPKMDAAAKKKAARTRTRNANKKYVKPNFTNGIYKILQAEHGESQSIGRRSMDVINQAVVDLIDAIANEAVQLGGLKKGTATVNFRDMKAAVDLLITGKDARKAAAAAAEKFSPSA